MLKCPEWMVWSLYAENKTKARSEVNDIIRERNKNAASSSLPDPLVNTRDGVVEEVPVEAGVVAFEFY